MKDKNELKLNFYDDFHCTASSCPMTCCMQWKIAVDADTYQKWKNYRYEGSTLNKYVCGAGAERRIRLNKDKFCPFLNQEHLCQLVVNYGEDILSHTCDIFPRQIQEFDQHTEYSLVACCPEVVDFMAKGKIKVVGDLPEEDEASLLSIRQLLMQILENAQYSSGKNLQAAFYVLLDIFENYQNHKNWEEIKEYYTLDELEKLYQRLDSIATDAVDTFEEDNELWLDMVENYRKEKLYSSILEPISELAEEYCEGFDSEKLRCKIVQFNEYIKKYEGLLHNYLVAEVFSNALIPEGDLESMVVMLQWIALEFVMIRHGLFLLWQQEEQLDYAAMRELIVVVARMTGYDQEDIYEYFENSFQELVWKWGYLALITGSSEENI